MTTPRFNTTDRHATPLGGKRLPRRFFSLKPVVLLLLIVGPWGCQSSDQVEPPQAQVAIVRLIEQTPQAAKLEIELNLANPNLVALPVIQCDYTLKLTEGQASNAAAAHTFTDQLHHTLPGGVKEGGSRIGRQTVTLPATVPAAAYDLKGAWYDVQGTISYEPPGEVPKLLHEFNGRLPTFHFKGSGRVQ